MKILIISQVFWPDETAGSQILTDLAEALVEDGFDIDVITSRNAYENEKMLYEKREVYRGIRIRRLRTSFFGKSSKAGRLVNFLCFNIALFLFIVFQKRGSYDLALSLSVPPLVPFFAMTAARLKRLQFIFWAMDLQPELAIASGYLKPKSVIARILSSMSDLAYKQSDLVVALDDYMGEHIRKHGAKPERIEVIAVWPVMREVYEGKRLENPFRLEHGFGDKVVVMYSGNHAVAHPLDTLLDAALALRAEARFLFVFIGGGVRKKDVTVFAAKHRLNTIVQLPYQPRETIHLSLSSADIHAVVLGEACSGYTHPSKLYGVMAIARPVLYVGPKESYIADTLRACPGNISVEHGEAELLADDLVSFAARGPREWEAIGSRNRDYVEAHFSKERLTQRFVSRIKSLASAPSRLRGS